MFQIKLSNDNETRIIGPFGPLAITPDGNVRGVGGLLIIKLAPPDGNDATPKKWYTSFHFWDTLTIEKWTPSNA